MKRPLAIVLVAASLAVAACSGGGDASPDTDSSGVDAGGSSSTAAGAAAASTSSTSGGSGPTSSTAADPESLEAAGIALAIEEGTIAPLTGLPVDEDDPLFTRPALVVKTDNAPQARPQAGLDVADVVFEEPVEGITRFLAVYHSIDPVLVGPIRSARGIDANTVRPLHALFAISGGVAGFVRTAREASQVLFTQGTPGYFRDRNRPGTNNLFANSGELWTQAVDNTPPQPLFSFLDPGSTFDGDAVSGIGIHNLDSFSQWLWDARTKTWLRALNNTPHVTIGDAQIAFENVIIQYINPRRGVETGEGDAVVFVDGQMITGRWIKPAPDQPTRFVTAFGVDIALSRGQTWVNFVPIGTQVDVVR